jgi:hypothetical protein
MQRLINAWYRAAHTGPATGELIVALFPLAYAVTLGSGMMAHTRFAAILTVLLPMPVWVVLFLALAIGQVAAPFSGRYQVRRLVGYLGAVVWGSLAGLLFLMGVLITGYAVIPTAISTVQFVTPALASILIVVSLTLLWQESRYDA